MVPIGWIFTLLGFFLSLDARELFSSREKNFENLEFAPPCPPLFEREEREGGWRRKKITKATGLFSRSPSLSRSFLPNFLHI